VKKQDENRHCDVLILELEELSHEMQKSDYTGMAVLEYYSILTFTVEMCTYVWIIYCKPTYDY
jgi:hypothetical protein